MKFIKRPLVVDAMQLPPSNEGASDDLIAFLHEMSEDWETEAGGYILIHTLEGDMVGSPGDWIIKGIKGEYYPCRADIFEATYDRVYENGEAL